MALRLAAMFLRVDADTFEEDPCSYQERQRRLAARNAGKLRKTLVWFNSLRFPAKLLVSVWAVTIGYTALIFGMVIGLIIRFSISGS